VHLPKNEGSLKENRVAVREGIRVLGAGSFREVAHPVPVGALVGGGGAMDGVVRVGKLGCRVDELAAAERRLV
jgi:hypothetical protein